MPDKIEMAKAYVQIVPSADGIRAALTDVFDEETDGLGAKVGQSIGAQLVGTIKKVLAAAGIGKIIKDSIDMGGALQQSIGGIETLFGAGGKSIEEYAQSVGKSVDAVKDEYASLMQSQQTVFDNAAQAYKTVGLSANDYMEQTTSFAASLLSSVSKDTNAAAQLANMAMVDMADNANKMGTDIDQHSERCPRLAGPAPDAGRSRLLHHWCHPSGLWRICPPAGAGSDRERRARDSGHQARAGAQGVGRRKAPHRAGRQQVRPAFQLGHHR